MSVNILEKSIQSMTINKEIPSAVRMTNQLKANNQEPKASAMEPTAPVSDLLLPTDPPPVIKRIIELMSDLDLTMADVDRQIVIDFPELREEGWKVGSTRKFLKKYPILKTTIKQSRALLWRDAGMSRLDAYKVIADAKEAVKIAGDGSEAIDHKTRMDASDRFLGLNGEAVKGSGTSVHIGGDGDHKIMIVTSKGEQI